MKTCPHCGEILGDSVDTCFNCMYSFKLKRIITSEEQQKEQKKKVEEQQRKVQAEKEKLEAIEAQKSIQLSKNPLFEYQVVIVNNLETGQIDIEEMQAALDTWSEKGWQLHSIFNNELGKTSSSAAIGFLGTIDETVLIFERCIKAVTD